MVRSLGLGLMLLPSILAMDARADGACAHEHPDYAESFMLSAISIDGQQELALRMARHPNRGSGTIWMHLAIEDVVYSRVVEQISVHRASSCDGLEAPWSEVRLGEVVVTRNGNSEQASIRVDASLKASKQRHPESGEGDHPVALSLEFRPDGREFRVHDGMRLEIYGEIWGTVTTPGRAWALRLPAKWHEQTGPRPAFAPSFTYLNLQNDETALLAIKYPRGVVGYLIDANGQRRVIGLEIDPEGPDRRRFRIEVEGGDDITGIASVAQRWSVPVDGKRRPGSGVVVESSIGTLAGSLNDWVDPQYSASAQASRKSGDRIVHALSQQCGDAFRLDRMRM